MFVFWLNSFPDKIMANATPFSAHTFLQHSPLSVKENDNENDNKWIKLTPDKNKLYISLFHGKSITIYE